MRERHTQYIDIMNDIRYASELASGGGEGRLASSSPPPAAAHADRDDRDDDVVVDDVARERRRRLEMYRERKKRNRWSPSSSSPPSTAPRPASSSSPFYHDDRRQHHDVTRTTPFLVLVALLALALAIQFVIVFGWHHARHDERVLGRHAGVDGVDVGVDVGVDGGVGGDVDGGRTEDAVVASAPYDPTTAHLTPILPPLPPILNVRRIVPGGSRSSSSADDDDLVEGVLSGERPTVAGMALVLSRFLDDMRESNRRMASRGPPHRVQRDEVHESFFRLAREHLVPLEDAYRGRSIFPIRDDGSIFVSLASFRDHLLGDTLKGAFDQAKRPDRLYVGVVVQNCLGLDPYPGEAGSQCRTGAQVVGKGPHGHDRTKVSDAPPDRNGVEEFCVSENHRRYCDSGQVRALYLHEDESLGPAMARYYASKLWGGESYFVQVDSHLEFYRHWDELYVNELRAGGSYPMAMLSAYPPGFGEDGGGRLGGEPSPGSRLCHCEFSTNDVEDHILRINSGVGYRGDEAAPTQIPFVAAGFFFAPSSFLRDVPFDPYLPWCFMGEEIMLSMRAWTHGYDVYAPRKNWIAHQYRPGRMGLPKFWGSVGRLFGRPGPGFSNVLQERLIKRVKFLLGYEDCCTREKIVRDGDEMVLVDVEHYGFGDVRSREEYLSWAKIDIDAKTCHSIDWCNKGELL